MKEKFKKRIARIGKNESVQDAMRTMNHAEAAAGLTEWIGAIFFYVLSLGKKPFAERYSKKHKTRNIIIGYLFNLLVVIGLYTLLLNLLPPTS